MLMLKWKYARIKAITKLVIKGLMSEAEFVIEFQQLQNEIYFLESLQ